MSHQRTPAGVERERLRKAGQIAPIHPCVDCGAPVSRTATRCVPCNLARAGLVLKRCQRCRARWHPPSPYRKLCDGCRELARRETRHRLVGGRTPTEQEQAEMASAPCERLTVLGALRIIERCQREG